MDVLIIPYAILSICLLIILICLAYSATMVSLIVRAYLTKDYRRLIAFCSLMIKWRTLNVRSYAVRGWAYAGQGDYRKAIEDCNESEEYERSVLMSNATRRLIYSVRAAAYFMLKDYERALEEANRAIALRPLMRWNFRLYHIKGHVYAKLKDYEQAIANYNRALELNPRNNGGYHSRGYAYLALNNIEQGCADLRKSLEMKPQEIVHAWMVAWCDYCFEPASMDTEAFVQRLNELAESNTKHYLSHLCRGVALWFSDAFTEALAELEQARAAEPNSEDTLLWIGMSYAMLGRDEEARDALEQALALYTSPLQLATLRLLEQKQPEFYQQYVVLLYKMDTVESV